MGRGSKGRKGKKKSNAKRENPNKAPVKAHRDGQGHGAQYDVYGGNRHDQRSKPSTFNPSTINDRAAGDDDLTLTDLTPPRDNDSGNKTLVEDDAAECYGVDIFLAASKRNRRGHVRLPQKTSTTSKPQRSLSGLYEEHPDMRLSNIEGGTLELAGQSVKQVVFEATHGFLRKCISEADRDRVWAHILGHTYEANNHGHKNVSIRVPDDTLDLKDGRRPLDLLKENCIHTLSSDFTTSDPTALKLVFNHAIVLCDALDDSQRRDALARALHALDWLLLGLEVKTASIYKSINQELDNVWMRYPLKCCSKDETHVTEARRQGELDALKSHKFTYDGLKEPFRVGFLQTLQNLVSLKG